MRYPPVRRGACAIIVRDDGKILLQLRCSGAWIYPNCWAAFGGGVKSGEFPPHALRRELFKELGFRVHAHKLIQTAWHRKRGPLVRVFTVRDYTYLVRWHSTCLRQTEGKDRAWFTIKEALDEPSLPPHEKSVLRKLLKRPL